MIHFFPRFSRTAEDSPFGVALRKIGVPHRILGTAVRQDYRHRWQLLLLGYPDLVWSALTVAYRSLRQRHMQPPDAVVLSSDVEVLVFAFVRLLPGSAKPRIVFMPFIFTARASSAINRARLAYYRFVLRCVDLAICHSALEPARYREIFAGCGARFEFVPWGTHVPPVAEITGGSSPPPPPSRPVLVAAGRSGRDYPSLAAAAAALPCQVVIVCNDVAALQGVTTTDSVTILDHCFGHDYLRQVLEADMVVVPLRVADISAGQMVMIQAMALARPLIVTDTPTVGDYLQDGVTALLTPRGEIPALRSAIQRLLADPAFAARLGAAAQAVFQARFSNEAHLRAVIATVLGQQHASASSITS